MCGIIAYIGHRPVVEVLVKGLQHLEYRGYDSAGISVNNGKPEVHHTTFKAVGQIKNLRAVIDGTPKESYAHATMGIAHTRWATHGPANEINCHPHFSNDKKFALVHNGIIENKDDLREELEEYGYTFYSQTDTEVIPVLLEYYMTQSSSFEDALVRTIVKLRGAFGVVIMQEGSDVLYAARLGSPLCIGIGEDEIFVASEPGAFIEYTNNVIHLETHEFASVSRRPEDTKICKLGVKAAGGKQSAAVSQRMAFSDVASTPISSRPAGIPEDGDVDPALAALRIVQEAAPAGAGRYTKLHTPRALDHALVQERIVEVPMDIEEVRKGQYAHFMLKEIHDQPRALQNTVGGKTRSLESINRIHLNIPEDVQSINFVACGTSWHAALIGDYLITNLAGIRTSVFYASEYITKRCLLGPRDMCFAISQSGETADTREALRRAKDSGCACAGIINVVGSQIARLCGSGIYLHAGPELGVASTKAFTCQVAAINLICARLCTEDKTKLAMMDALRQIPDTVQKMLEDAGLHAKVKQAALEVQDSSNAMFLGRGVDFPVALEGALKLKEISYIHAEGYPAGEMKHGPIALIDENMPVFFVVGCGAHDDGDGGNNNFEKVISNMEEVKTRKGRIITITDHVDRRLERLSSILIQVPYISDSVAPILKTVPLQLISYHVAVARGLDPDRPRNLAKSVTVE